MKTRLIIASVLASAAVVSAANAEFATGNIVQIAGQAGPQFQTYWGGDHDLGFSSQFPDPNFPALFVAVSSTVINPNRVDFSFDFSQFGPGDFSSISFDITHLKADGSINFVSASQGTITTDGNNVHWEGTGADLDGLNGGDYKLRLTVEQVPAPGALALMGVAGLVGSRRRRA